MSLTEGINAAKARAEREAREAAERRAETIRQRSAALVRAITYGPLAKRYAQGAGFYLPGERDENRG